MYVHIEHYDGFNNWMSRDFNARDMMQHVKRFKHVPRERFMFYNRVPHTAMVKYNPNTDTWEMWIRYRNTDRYIRGTHSPQYKKLKNALNALERVSA